MAYPQMAAVPTKLSFAKIAAMPAPHTPARNNHLNDTKTPPNSLPNSQSQPSKLDSKTKTSVKPPKNLSNENQMSQTTMESLNTTIQGLSLVDDESAVIHTARSGESGDSIEEDQSQLSMSSLNKPHSFDTKSMASVTTFAMDDKESIRPDDSASVRAADDDVPQVGLSRNSSFQHDVEIPGNTSKHVLPSAVNVTIAARRYPTLTNPPRFGNLPVNPIVEAGDSTQQRPSPPVVHTEEPRQSSPALGTVPDESLIEALASANRLLLLHLEERVLDFLNAGVGEILEFPPQNAFTRMLTHKLADYYNLAHHINEDNSSVRVFRTGPRSLPIPLAQLAKSAPNGPAQLPSSSTVKIMRRAQLASRPMSVGNSTAPSSSAPSKTTSEYGAETNSDEGLVSPQDGTPNKDRSKLTREEREAQYKAARDRIFGDFQESAASETASTGENSASMSRSSSSSGKKKSKKHKQPRDDSFEARSAFMASYTPTAAQFGPNYGETPYPGAFQTLPGGYPQNAYSSTPTLPYATFDSGMEFVPQQNYGGTTMRPYSPAGWQNMHNSQSMQGSYFPYQQPSPFPQHGHMMPQMNGQFMQPQQQTMHPSQGWVMDQYPGYATSPQPTQNMHWSGYGPPNMRSPAPSTQYVPGAPQMFGNMVPPNMTGTPFAGNKSLFNPQTRSFIPSYTPNRGGGGNNRKKANTKNQVGSGSVTPLTTSSASSPMPKEDSLRQKYGTPASLPKKPPPSEVNPASDGHPVSAGSQIPSNSASNRPLVVNSTSNVPA